MSDNEYEPFSITDNEFESAFNVNRPRHGLTKNQQIYGIWADDSDNDSDREVRGRSGRSRRVERKFKDYAAPVSFVAGGVQQAGKKKLENQEKNADKLTIDDQMSSYANKTSQLMDGSDDSSSEEAYSSRAEKPVQQQSINNTSSSKNLGAWQKHTRGIGAKLLLQMGYKPGMGLGKDLQGISKPVEAHVRRGRGAIGAYGPEIPAKVDEKTETTAGRAIEKVQMQDFKYGREKWKKVGDKAKLYYYKSVEEIIEKGKKTATLSSDKISNKFKNVPVIDMTGPEKRVLSGYHAIGHTKQQDEDIFDSFKKEGEKKKEHFAAPELIHNIQIVVDVFEDEIICLDKTECEIAGKKDSLEHECKNLKQIVQLEGNHISTLKKTLSLVEQLINCSGNMNLKQAEQIFVELQLNYSAEYEEFHLAELAVSIIAPLLKQELDNWQPLEQPTRHVDTVKRWRSLLDPNNVSDTQTRNKTSRIMFDPYSSLLWAGVIPSFRACAKDWVPKQHQNMVTLLNNWAPVFPISILDSVLEELVLSRICTEVRNWDPQTDIVPIHSWIMPWQSILDNKMEEQIYPTIRKKLGAALEAWVPQDRSVRAMLLPWKNAFDKDEMQKFLLQYIIPKLQLVLNALIINPLQQDLELWNQVWEWHELIPPILMAQLLDRYFFPKWMQVLSLWLNQTPDYGEISRWFKNWKNLLNEELLSEPIIKTHFRRALEMMHRSTQQLDTTEIDPNAPILLTVTPPAVSSVNAAYVNMQIAGSAPTEFKEIVSQKCAERGILFAPISGRRELGKQVYRAGKLYCYIDRTVCMVSDNGFQDWSPISLAMLLDRAATG